MADSDPIENAAKKSWLDAIHPSQRIPVLFCVIFGACTLTFIGTTGPLWVKWSVGTFLGAALCLMVVHIFRFVFKQQTEAQAPPEPGHCPLAKHYELWNLLDQAEKGRLQQTQKGFVSSILQYPPKALDRALKDVARCIKREPK